MNKILTKLLCVFILLPLFSMASTDSLMSRYQKILSMDIKTQAKVDSLNLFGRQITILSDSIALLAINEALKLADQEGYTKGVGVSHYLISRREERKGNMQKAIDHALESISILERVPVGYELIDAHLIAGWIYRRMMQKGKAMEFTMDGLKLAEETADTFRIGDAYNNISALYAELQDHDKALYYLQQSLYWRELSKDTMDIAVTHGNIGLVYRSMKQYDKALESMKRALNMTIKANIPSNIAFFYNDIGSVYMHKGNTDSAIYYLRKSIDMREQMRETNEIAYTYNFLGEAYEKTGNIQEGEKWIRKALNTAIATNNIKQHHGALESLSNFYARNGKYDSAYVYLYKHKLLGDTINETKREALVDELATQYETEKKEQQIEILNREKALQQLKLRQRNLLWAGTAGIFMLITGGVYLWQNRRKIRAEARLQRQAAQDVLQAEERERRRIATDLHDGVGQMLSAALLNLNDVLDKTSEGASKKAAEKALSLLDESYREMRSISHQMMPNALLKAGLASSVREFLEKIDGDKIKVSLDVVGLDEKLDEQTETVLYRVIQEAVNNVIKHADASRLTIQLTSDNEGVDVTVEDNGRGFDTSGTLEFEGIGLRNIRSRVALLGGTLDLDSASGRGTLLVIHIPGR